MYTSLSCPVVALKLSNIMKYGYVAIDVHAGLNKKKYAIDGSGFDR